MTSIPNVSNVEEAVDVKEVDTLDNNKKPPGIKRKGDESSNPRLYVFYRNRRVKKKELEVKKKEIDSRAKMTPHHHRQQLDDATPPLSAA